MATSLTPIQINQIINKKAGDPITADDWNGILNLLIEQNNLLSEQLQSLKSNIQQITTDIVQSLLDNGTLSLNVDASKLGGIDASEYALSSDLTSLSEAIANSYTSSATFSAFQTTVNLTLSTLANTITAATIWNNSPHTDYFFKNYSLNTIDINNTRGNWVASISDTSHGTVPYPGSWNNIIQFDGTHFLTQIATRPGTPSGPKIRTKYTSNENWSGWVDFAAGGTSSNTESIEDALIMVEGGTTPPSVLSTGKLWSGF